MTKPKYVKKQSNLTSDGRLLKKEDWRPIPEFPGYQMTKDGDIRSLRNMRILQEVEAPTGGFYYSLWKEGHEHAYKRAYQPLLYSTWPELLKDWKEIPHFPGYLINQQGQVMGTRRYQILNKTKSGEYRLMKDGKRRSFYFVELFCTDDDWNNFWGEEAA